LQKSLPFALTGAQARVYAQLRHDLAQPHPMLRLVQGDVGSGKTVVAALAAMLAVEGKRQAALMAPTELLAEQHLVNLRGWLEPLGVRVAWLAGKVTGKARASVLAAVASGEAQVVVGTHALMQEGVAVQRPRAGDRRRATSFRRAPAPGLARQGRGRRQRSAPTGDDGHADPAHARDGRLRRPRRLGDRRTPARPHAGADGRAEQRSPAPN
jgi:hypothetical protein